MNKICARVASRIGMQKNAGISDQINKGIAYLDELRATNPDAFDAITVALPTLAGAGIGGTAGGWKGAGYGAGAGLLVGGGTAAYNRYGRKGERDDKLSKKMNKDNPPGLNYDPNNPQIQYEYAQQYADSDEAIRRAEGGNEDQKLNQLLRGYNPGGDVSPELASYLEGKRDSDSTPHLSSKARTYKDKVDVAYERAERAQGRGTPDPRRRRSW